MWGHSFTWKRRFPLSGEPRCPCLWSDTSFLLPELAKTQPCSHLGWSPLCSWWEQRHRWGQGWGWGWRRGWGQGWDGNGTGAPTRQGWCGPRALGRERRCLQAADRAFGEPGLSLK